MLFFWPVFLVALVRACKLQSHFFPVQFAFRVFLMGVVACRVEFFFSRVL